MIGMRYICVYSLIAFYVKGHHQWITNVCVTVIIAVLNINVKGYWAVGINQTLLVCMYQTGLPLVCVLLSLWWRLLLSMGSSCRNSNLSQEYRLYLHTQIWHIHTLDLFLPVLSKLYQWRERKVCFDSISEVETQRPRSVFTPFFIQNVWFLNKHQRGWLCQGYQPCWLMCGHGYGVWFTWVQIKALELLSS